MAGGRMETTAMASHAQMTKSATIRTAMLAFALTLPEHVKLGGHQRPTDVMTSSATMTNSVRAGLALEVPAL